MVEKLTLIGRRDHQQRERAIQEGNLPAALASADHEQRTVERHARYGYVRTDIQGPPQQRPVRSEGKK